MIWTASEQNDRGGFFFFFPGTNLQAEEHACNPRVGAPVDGVVRLQRCQCTDPADNASTTIITGTANVNVGGVGCLKPRLSVYLGKASPNTEHTDTAHST